MDTVLNSVMDATLCACAGCSMWSSIYKCTFDIMNTTGLSYYIWNDNVPKCGYDRRLRYNVTLTAVSVGRHHDRNVANVCCHGNCVCMPGAPASAHHLPDD